jgi:lipoprotein signal peptidase
MKERYHRLLLWGLALFGAAADQVSKYGVFKWLYHDGEGGQWEIIPGVIRLLVQYTSPQEPRVNQGALFSLGNEYAHVSNAFLAVTSFVVAVAILYWSLRPSASRGPLLCAALGLILAGAVGNLYDRVVFHGVRDFLHFYWFEWPVFNVADCCLVCGACLLVLSQIIGHHHAAAETKA